MLPKAKRKHYLHNPVNDTSNTTLIIKGKWGYTNYKKITLPIYPNIALVLTFI